MVKFFVFLVLIASTSPAFAEDTPWFGSEASIAEQITLSNGQLVTQDEIVLNTQPKCPIETCPVTDKLAK